MDDLCDTNPIHRVGQEIPFRESQMNRGDFLIKRKKDKRRLFERRLIFVDEKNFLVTASSTVRNGQVIVRSVTPLRHIRMRPHSRNANAIHLFAYTDRNSPMLQEIVVFGNPQWRQEMQNLLKNFVNNCMEFKRKVLEKIIHINGWNAA